MNEDIRYLLATVCVFPAAIGIYKYKRVNSSFHPFIYMMLLDVIVETIIYIYIKFPQLGHKQFIAVNIYMLLNFFLFLSLVTSYNYLNKKGAVVLFVIAVIFGTGNFIYSKTALDPLSHIGPRIHDFAIFIFRDGQTNGTRFPCSQAIGHDSPSLYKEKSRWIMAFFMRPVSSNLINFLLGSTASPKSVTIRQFAGGG